MGLSQRSGNVEIILNYLGALKCNPRVMLREEGEREYLRTDTKRVEKKREGKEEGAGGRD